MSETLSSQEARQLVVDALVGAAVLHAGVDPVLLPSVLDWVIKLQKVMKLPDAAIATLRREGAALLDDPVAVDHFISKARKEQWTSGRVRASMGPDNVIRVKTRDGKRTELMTVEPNREIVIGAPTRSSYYGLAVTVARDTERADTARDGHQASEPIPSLAALARSGNADLEFIKGAANGVAPAFAAAARAGGIGEGLVNAITDRLGQFSDIAHDAWELEGLGGTLSFQTVEMPQVAFIEQEPPPESKPRPEPSRGNGTVPPPANGNDATGDPPGTQAGANDNGDGGVEDPSQAEADIKAFSHGFLSVLSDALIGVDIVLGFAEEHRRTAIHLLTQAKRARSWSEDDFAKFTNDPHLRGLPGPVRARIIAVVMPEVGKARRAAPNPSGVAASGLVEYDLLTAFEGLSFGSLFADAGRAFETEVIAVTGDARTGDGDARRHFQTGRGAWDAFVPPGPWRALAAVLVSLAEVGATGSRAAVFQAITAKILAGEITKGLAKTGKYDFGSKIEEKAREYGLSDGNPRALDLAKRVDRWILRIMEDSIKQAINDVFDFVGALTRETTE